MIHIYVQVQYAVYSMMMKKSNAKLKYHTVFLALMELLDLFLPHESLISEEELGIQHPTPLGDSGETYFWRVEKVSAGPRPRSGKSLK